MKVYLVGGAVRDELLKRPVHDRDWVVVGATPQLLLDKGYQQIGSEFPCFLHPDTKEEYALARTERKSGKGYKGFICDFGPEITLEEDLSRRDLTINAIAKDLSGNYIDPYRGVDDLNAGILRHVSPAFAEDPLRVLRVARFAARFADRGFSVHPETLALMQQLVVAGEMKELTPERVWKEMSRALTESRPSVFFTVLAQCDALAELLPEISALFSPKTDGSTAGGTMPALSLLLDNAQALFDDPVVNWAVLLHRLDQDTTAITDAISARFRLPNEYRNLSELVAKYHLRCANLLQVSADEVMQLIEALDGIRRPERVALFANACHAIHAGAEPQFAPAGRLIKSLEAIKKVDAKPLLAQGFKGIALAKELRRARILQIESLH